MRLLVVEDEQSLREGIAKSFGYPGTRWTPAKTARKRSIF